MKVCHLTSVHFRYDVRIFLKECQSFARAGYDVTLIVADGMGSETKNDVSILDAGKPLGRGDRLLNSTRKVFEKAKLLDADVYHFHDPELIPVGLKLKKIGKIVLFDAHEDVPKQLLGKPYLNPMIRHLLSTAFSMYEANVCRKFDAVVSATPTIREKYSKINDVSIDVNNFPILDELTFVNNWESKSKTICYVGGLEVFRGIREMILAMEHVSMDIHLLLAGRFSQPNVQEEVQTMAGWKYTNYLGFLDRQAIRDVLNQSMIGLVTLHPLKNYLDSLPIKMFEYMCAGIPVIASDFPLWRKIVEGSNCGLCVDPLNPRAIAEAIDYLIANPNIAVQMGKNGQDAIHKYYNWSVEERKLLKLYNNFTAQPALH